ncbi:MAG: HXXEE domain-containing protein [Pseudomonadota bacterium]
MTSHAYLIWLCLSAYAIFILEKVMFDWQNWAQNRLGLMDVNWPEFYSSSAVMIVVGMCCAMTGWSEPAFALLFPALMLIKSVLFYLIPLVFKARFRPGVFSSIVLFIPLACWTFNGAYNDDMITPVVVIVAFALGALLLALPMLFYRLKRRFH